MCLCKDTNFKANHNAAAVGRTRNVVVCAYAKILILKQITTGEDTKRQHYQLYVPMQRY